MKIISILRAKRSRRQSAFILKLTSITVLSILILNACAASATPTTIPTVVLDGGSTTNNNDQSSNDDDSVSASAVIVPVKDVQLAFASVGRVTAVNVKVGDKVAAGQVLVTLDSTIQEARVREAEANLLAAQVDYNYKKRLGLDPVHLETADAEIARTQALVDSAKAILASQYTLVAPINGTIISLDIAPAETVVPGGTVVVLGDLSSFKIETTDLSERDVTRVQVGDPATIFIEAFGEEFTGNVMDIDRVASTLGGDVVYRVTIGFDSQPQGLLWGMSADVQIETAQ